MTAGTTKERFKAVQRRLGVNDDGILGPVTLSRIEALLDGAFGPSRENPQHSLVVSRKGLAQIVQFEISSEANYRRRLSRPLWPKGASGITIGIGYDLGYTPKDEISDDWRGKIADFDLDELVEVGGLKGEAAERALPLVEHIRIPMEAAKDVFYTSTLPKYAGLTRNAYPGVEDLPADAQAMVLSLVFNRGTSMAGSGRREMKALQPLVAAQDLNGIAEEIRAMKRLWDPAILRGLHVRRDKEAEMVAHARMEYEPAELCRV